MNKEPIFEMISIESLQFDPNNPRFPAAINGNDMDTVLDFMLKDAGLLDLMRSIASQGFFPGEPVLVTSDPTTPGNWVVIEGNRRLAACLLLRNPERAPTNKTAVLRVASELVEAVDTLPSLIFETRHDILKHLGYRHVTGIKEWAPLAKAKFLKQRYDELSEDTQSEKLRAVARTIGSRSDYVGRLLTAAELFSKIEDANFFDLHNVSEASIDFSLITSALAYTSIVQHLGLLSSSDMSMSDLDLKSLKDLTQIMFERDEFNKTRLGESRNLRKLVDIIEAKKTRALLTGGLTLDQAWDNAGGSTQLFNTLLLAAKANIEQAISELATKANADQATSEIVVRGLTEQDLALVSDLFTTLEKLSEEVDLATRQETLDGDI